MYTLILITLLSTGTVVAENKGVYSDMAACFDGRDNILVEYGAWNGLMPEGTQAVCVRTPNSK